jgi:hypothetical protein
MRPTVFAIATGVATLVALAGSARAQTRELTADEVKLYFSQVQQDVMQLVRSGNIEGIDEWADRHVANDAHFKIFVEASHDNMPKMWSAIDLDKADAQRMRAMLGGQVLRSIQDYSLKIDVGRVVPHGPDAATVKVTYTDSVKLMPPAAAAAAAGQAQSTVGQAPQTGAQQNAVEIKRAFDCDQLLVREQGQLKIGLSSCRGHVQL